MPAMDYSALRGRIHECGLTQKEVAEKVGISESHLVRKMSGEFAFRQDEIDRIIKLLKIDPCEIGRYFFSPKN